MGFASSDFFVGRYTHKSNRVSHKNIRPEYFQAIKLLRDMSGERIPNVKISSSYGKRYCKDLRFSLKLLIQIKHDIIIFCLKCCHPKEIYFVLFHRVRIRPKHERFWLKSEIKRKPFSSSYGYLGRSQ